MGCDLVISAPSDLCQGASNGSKAMGTVDADETVTALFWCFDDEEDDEFVWWVLKPANGDPIARCPRMHASNTYQRPF